MPRFLVVCVVTGLVAGLLVGGFHNLFTVPVMERAIAFEEERSAQQPSAEGDEEGGTPVSLGLQRVGMAAGTGIYGVVLGLVFAGGYTLLRRARPHWQPLALAATIAVIGFWAVSLFPFIKYPVNPPGVGEEGTLLFRQFYQAAFIVLSTAAAAAVLLGLSRINSMKSSAFSAGQMQAMLALAYLVFAVVIFLAIPGNPDPTPVPIDLLELFRALSMVGQFLLWALLAAGVTLAAAWQGQGEQAEPGPRPSTQGARSGLS